MSLHLPRARLFRPAAATTSSLIHPRPLILLHQRRTLFEWIHGRKRDTAAELSKRGAPLDPESMDFKKRIAESRAAANLKADKAQGELASSSIFGGEEEDQGAIAGQATKQPAGRNGEGEASPILRLQLNPYLTAPKLDPAPRARERWLRKQVARAVRTQGAVSKDVARRRRERERLSQGEWLPTSQKKLMPVARQIAGKTVDEALVQLRFSRKLVAQDVARNLLVARQEAILGHGMGLGPLQKQQQLQVPGTMAEGSQIEEQAASQVGLQKDDASSATKAVTILDKRGRRQTIADPTTIYIAQAWINRGPYGRVPEYRARGKMNILRPPYTRIAFLLKEHKTLIREAADRAAKAKAKKPWVHHPDRPLRQPGQFVQW